MLPGATVEPDPDGSRSLRVADSSRPIAVVRYSGTALDDPETAAAVRRAVRLTITHRRLLDEQSERLAQQRDAGVRRLLAATDLAREQLAAELRREVQAPIAAARRHVDAARDSLSATGSDDTVAGALGIAVEQLSSAEAEIGGLTAGAPPAALGNGRLHDALSSLADGSPLTVVLDLDGDAYASAGRGHALLRLLGGPDQRGQARRRSLRSR